MTDSAARPPPDSPAADAVWAWDQYWRDGRLASCGGAGGTNYQPAIAEGWRRFFSRLPPGARVLDVCSGNGAVARIAAENAVARGTRFGIEAVDAAELAPPALPGEIAAMIAFRNRTAAESLPYPATSFDCVAGQYAVEYTDLDRSLPELARVAAPACRVRFVCHAAEGIVVATAGRQLRDVVRLRETCDIFSLARTVAEAQTNGEREALTRATERYRDGIWRLRRAATESQEPEMYRNVSGVISHALSVQARVGVQPVRDKIDEAATTLAAHEARLQAMTAAAVDSAGAESLAARAAGLWDRPFGHAPALRRDGLLLGWIVESQDAP